MAFECQLLLQILTSDWRLSLTNKPHSLEHFFCIENRKKKVNHRLEAMKSCSRQIGPHQPGIANMMILSSYIRDVRMWSRKAGTTLYALELERHHLTAYTTTNTVSLSTATCSTPGWLRVNNSCYKEFNEQVNWFTAQQACQNLNSNLTSIHSGAENKVIREKVASSIYSRYWIGLNNLRNNSVFEWNDGSSVSFTKWYPDEPNNNGDENCTEVVDNVAGEWNDLNCYTHYRSYVCEKQWNL